MAERIFEELSDAEGEALREDIRTELRFRRETRNAEALDAALELCGADAEQQVYFIQMAEAKHIKIGIAKRPDYRLGELQVGNPERLSIIATTTGGRSVEKMLHVYLSLDRLQGEWFRWSERSESLLNFIAMHPKKPVSDWVRQQRIKAWQAVKTA